MKPSSKKNKKIDVIRKGEVVASVGDKRYADYGAFLIMEAKGQMQREQQTTDEGRTNPAMGNTQEAQQAIGPASSSGENKNGSELNAIAGVV